MKDSKDKFILMALNRDYPTKRLTEYKLYYDFFKKRTSVKWFVRNTLVCDKDIISAGIDSKSLLVLEALFAFRLMLYILKNRRNIKFIMICSPILLCQFAIIVARLCGLRVVYDLRSAPIATGLKYRILWFLDILHLLFASDIITIDAKMLEVKYGRFFLKKSKVIPCGFPDIKKDRSPENHKGEKLRCVLISSIEIERKIDKVCDAFVELKNYELHIYGDGRHLKELMERYKLFDNILFCGHCDYNDLIQKLPEFVCGIAFIPQTAYYEYQPPLKTIEYLGAGLPVIATNTYGNKIYVNQSNGILIQDNPSDLREALLLLPHKNFKASKIIESVERFRWPILLENVLGRMCN